MQKLLLPLGVEDFKNVKEECYYVDKTMVINEIVNSPISRVFLFTRPRRFGKSLLVSMIDYFFNEKYDSKKLFENTKIYSSKDAMKELNKYPVIHINFKKLKIDNYDSLLYGLNMQMSVCYKNLLNDLNLDILLDNERLYIKKIIECTANENELSFCLENVMRYIYEITGKRTIILLDEYDAYIQNGITDELFNKINSFIKVFLGNALKGNNNLQKAVITGVNQLSNTSIFSELNNLVSNNLLGNREVEYFGFTKEETMELLSYYGYNSSFDNITSWYGGYRFQNENIYNPWSILSFVDSNFEYSNYWINTGSYTIIKELIRRISEEDFSVLGDMITGKKYLTRVNESISFNDLSSVKAIFSLLLFNGYFTFEKTQIPNEYFLKVPNTEIVNVFKDEILNVYEVKNQIKLLLELKDAFLKCDEIAIQGLLEKYFLSCLSYFDFNNEKNYQIMLGTIMVFLFEDMIVKYEVISGNGRCDIFLHSKSNNDLAILVEIKNVKGRRGVDRLNATVDLAIKQIKNKEYLEEAKRLESKKILIYGVVFNEKKVIIKSEKI